jgi:hypothetical protein
MKRLHVHVSVKDVPASIRFYRELFAANSGAQRFLRWKARQRALRGALAAQWREHLPGGLRQA